jgi:cellulose synthase/poly-beta-1,6-N-acetylglucosamine synthase-like glycosyltransferase/peptidoglycan/xylan/chitin deacetylase (PgdA/CDA1 family)
MRRPRGRSARLGPRRIRRSEAARRIGRRIERPPAHWSVLFLIVGGLLLLLFAQGLSTRATGASATPASVPTTSALAGSRPILVAKGDRLVSIEPPPGRRVALTFDDGPDPRWTPRIARVLLELHVPATFFEVGDRVVRRPDIPRALHRDGFELGNHTFTHSNLANLPSWQQKLQVALTEAAISGAAGIRPRMVRPPYSATPEAVTEPQLRAYTELAKRGYVIALSDYDGEDWRRPGVDEIVRNATPPKGRGGVILLHDGGGDRSETVAALRRLVPRLRGGGFRFVTLSEIAGLTRAEVEPPASSAQHLRGELLIGALGVARVITAALVILLIPIAVLLVLRAIFVVTLARRHAREWRRSPGEPDYTPPVSIVVPAYNESAVVAKAVRSLAASDYPDFEVIVVDDGSEDGTGEIVERLALDRVRVLREPNSGKSGALNTGVAAARHPVVVTVDADTVFEPDTLARLTAPFRDERVGAVAGNTKVGNRDRMLGRWQHIDYVIGFNLERRLYDVLQCMPTVPGAIGAFRRDALEAAGGFSHATLAEDTDVTIAIGRLGWRVVYAEDARAWTEVPSSLSALWRQRYRWSYGTMQAVWKHKGALVHRGEQRIGRLGLPYLIMFQIALPVLAPLIDVFAIYGLFFLNPWHVLAYWGAFNLLVLALGVFAFRLDGESPRPLWAMPLQQLVYRQLMYLVVIQSIVSALRGTRLRWQHVERTGDVEIAG